MYVCRGVIEDELSAKVIEAWRLRVEFKSNEREGFAWDLTEGWERFVGSARVLENFELDWGVTCIVELYSLIHRFS